jgi:hypothetical protein
MQHAVAHDMKICLKPMEEFRKLCEESHHIAPIYWFESAVEQVMDFLFTTGAAFEREIG